MALLDAILAAAVCDTCRADPTQQIWNDATGAIKAAYCHHRAVAVVVPHGTAAGVFVFEQIPAVTWRMLALTMEQIVGTLYNGWGGQPS